MELQIACKLILINGTSNFFSSMIKEKKDTKKQENNRVLDTILVKTSVARLQI